MSPQLQQHHAGQYATSQHSETVQNASRTHQNPLQVPNATVHSPFMQEEWYQPLENGPTVWYVIQDIIRTAWHHTTRFIKQRFNRERTHAGFSTTEAIKAIQAKPVYSLQPDGTPTPIWQPDVAQAAHYAGGGDRLALSKADMYQTAMTAELEEAGQAIFGTTPTTSLYNELASLDDINAWIAANITPPAASIEASCNDETNNDECIQEASSLECEMATECAEAETASDSQDAAPQASEWIEDSTQTVIDETAIDDEQLNHAIATVRAAEDNVETTEAPRNRWNDAELDHLNQVQNAELNALINGYFKTI
jgi:hypothetical protein